MSNTLVYKDTIQRVGYTIVDDVKIAQHTCVISSDNPEEIRITMTKLDANAYKNNRDVCRADFATFEDAAYELQEELIAKANA